MLQPDPKSLRLRRFKSDRDYGRNLARILAQVADGAHVGTHNFCKFYVKVNK